MRVSLLIRNDVYAFPAFADVIVMYNAICDSEKGVILALADVFTWMNFRAALPDDDVADNHTLTTELLHAQSLRMTVTAIAA